MNLKKIKILLIHTINRLKDKLKNLMLYLLFLLSDIKYMDDKKEECIIK